jgi:hypothetical protein
VVIAVAIVLAAVPSAHATVSISRAELSGTRLRIEGQALPNRSITVDGVVLGTSDAAGAFRVQKDPFRSDDCIVDVNDGSPTPTPARLSGCVVAAPVPPGATGTVGIIRGGNGFGRITSSPAGIDCDIAPAGVTGPCSADFPAGTRVQLDARPAADSNFLGWRPTPGCPKPDVTVVGDVVILCQPVFGLR